MPIPPRGDYRHQYVFLVVNVCNTGRQSNVRSMTMEDKTQFAAGLVVPDT